VVFPDVPAVGTKTEDSATALGRVAVVSFDLEPVGNELSGAGSANGSWGGREFGSGAGNARASWASLVVHALFLR
jgi:hypothetical protein